MQTQKLRAGRWRLFICSNVFLRHMRLLSKILWFFAFLAATFVWMVLFEHGFSMEGFSRGMREEWKALTSLVGAASSEEKAPAPPSSKQPSGAKK